MRDNGRLVDSDLKNPMSPSEVEGRLRSASLAKLIGSLHPFLGSMA
jgi:hypothetical protein